jgi:hypothetical protein
MKTILCIILLVPIVLRANEIDGLRTRQDVGWFVRKIDSHYRKGELFRRGGKDTGGLQDRFFKLDMDGDGRTDLVINGVWLIVVMDLGDHYELHNLGEVGSDYHGVQGLLAIDSGAVLKRLLVRMEKGGDWRSMDSAKFYTDTLVPFSGGMTEYNAHPDTGFRFEGLKVSTTMCFGTCPVFEMQIDTNRRVWYHATEFNKQNGQFTGGMPAAAYDRLVELLRYLPLDRLDRDYKVNWTDDQTITLEIHYDGKVKQVTDYGEIGTYGLRILYGMLFRYRDLIQWQPVAGNGGHGN